MFLNGATPEALGLTVESGELVRFATAIGSFEAYGHSVTLETLGYSLDVTVYFAADDTFKRNVLGRRGWLDHQRLALIDYKSELYLGRYEDSKGRTFYRNGSHSVYVSESVTRGH